MSIRTLVNRYNNYSATLLLSCNAFAYLLITLCVAATPFQPNSSGSQYSVSVADSNGETESNTDQHMTGHPVVTLTNFVPHSSSIATPFPEYFVQLAGFRMQGDRVEILDNQITRVLPDEPIRMLLYGFNFSTVESTKLKLTATPVRMYKNEDCKMASKTVFDLEVISDQLAIANVIFSIGDATHPAMFFCLDTGNWSYHQGFDPWMTLQVKGRLLPVWLQVMLIVTLLAFAALFSGLNLGLMALDPNELAVIECCGTATEQRYARKIMPLRKRGNYLLCTILLGNVMVQTTLTVMLEDLTSGFVAVIGSTFSIVVFGEIVPQSICSRQGLAIGANTVYLMYFFMVVTFPISYPISWILDKCLGKEIGKIYDRERLTEYLRITQRYNKLETHELNIIQGALKLKKMNVAEIMTKLEDVFSLPIKSVLNFDTLSLIQKSGFSRIPIYDQERSNIVAVLFAKDLAFVDPDDKVPIKTLCEYYNHQVKFLFEDQTLDVAFNEFKEGKSHMAFVVRISDDQYVEKDPHYEVIGLVTLEDVLEEVMQVEIVDETDVLTDNRRKKRRKEVQSRIDFTEFCLLNNGERGQHVVSPQMVLVAYQYLSTSVELFSKRYLTENVLRRLINQNIYHKEQVMDGDSSGMVRRILFEYGKRMEHFVLVLEGYVTVTMGKESLSFQSGPFSVFGVSALKFPDDVELTVEYLDEEASRESDCLADYTVQVYEKTTFLKLSRSMYISAVRNSLMERKSGFSDAHDEDSQRLDSLNRTADSFSKVAR